MLLAAQTSQDIHVSGYLIRAVVEVAHRHGVAAERLLGEANAAAYSALAEQRILLSDYQRLLERASELTTRPEFGLECGLHFSTSSFGLMSPLISHSRTLREAITLVTRFRALICEAFNIEVRELSNTTLLICKLPQEVRRSMTELIVAGMVQLLQTYRCTGSDVRAVCFEHRHPRYYAAYQAAFHGAQRFGQTYTGLEISSHAMDRPNLHWQPALEAAVHAEAERTIERFQRDLTFTERLQTLLRGRGKQAAPSASEAARSLGLSERSLRRRLELEGTSYRELAQASTFEAARDMLKDQHQTLKTIAHTLGYSCHASFHRAFARWAAATPGSFRPRRTRTPSG